MFGRAFFSLRGLVIVAAVALGLGLAALGGKAVAAQDKYTVSVPNGLAFSDFRGYENWQVVAVSQTEELLKVMVANPRMIDATGPAFPAMASLFPTVPRLQKSSGSRKRTPSRLSL